MSFADVKSSTSTSMGSDEDGGLFDETITAYKARRKHAKNLIVEAIKYAFPTSLRSYINKPQWLTIAEDSEAGMSTSLHLSLEHMCWSLITYYYRSFFAIRHCRA